jgi:hypothetical protein
MATRLPLADIAQEAAALLDAAGPGLRLRLLGGLAVWMQAPGGLHPAFVREYGDVDLAVPRRRGHQAEGYLAKMGYEPDRVFNATTGDRRLLFHDPGNGRRVDVFVGRFEMCHTIPIMDRVDVEPRTIPLAELLLTKLQVVQLTAKDRGDAMALLHHHPVADHDAGAVNAAVAAGLCAADWGLWRTCTENLERAREGIASYPLSETERSHLDEAVDRLRGRIDRAPKTAGWRLRARVGERKRWYREPEEVG